jgi:hypothetical protein
LPILVAAVGVAAAAASLWFVNNQAPAPLPAFGANSPEKATARRDDRGVNTQEPGPSGVDISNIPLDPGSPSSPGGSRPGKLGRPADTTVHAARPGKGEKPGDTEKGDSSDEASEPETSKPEPFEPQLLPPPDEKAPPLDQRAPLNRASALTALSGAANQAAACKRDGGPTGTGSVSVVFSPEGPVKSVTVSAPFGGTSVGSCVQTVFRNVRVQPFSGSAVTLSKSFRIAE